MKVQADLPPRVLQEMLYDWYISATIQQMSTNIPTTTAPKATASDGFDWSAVVFPAFMLAKR